MSTYGEELREIRLKMELSSREFARLAGVSHVYILDIERGAATPSDAIAARIATAVATGSDGDAAQKLRSIHAREAARRDTTAQARKGYGSGLRAWRESHQVSMRKLAAAAEMSHVYIGEIERGTAYPSAAVASRMLQAVERLSTANAADHLRSLYAEQPQEAARRRLADAVDRAQHRGVISPDACARIQAILAEEVS